MRSELQDAVHYAIMAVGGVDKHGRESTFSRGSRKTPRWQYMGGPQATEYDVPGNMTRADWRQKSLDAIKAAGLPSPRGLKGEKLIRYIDRVAQAKGFDAFSTDLLDSLRLDGISIANRKVMGRRTKARRLHSGRRR